MKHFSPLRAFAFICGFLLSLCAAASLAQVAAPVQVHDPIARDLLATNPTEPRELLNVANLLVDLREPQAAVPLLKKLEASGLDEAKLAALADEFGTATLVKLSADPVVGPAAKEFVASVLAAADKQSRDPEYLAGQIEKLKSPATGVRAKAMTALARGREAAVAALLEVLQDAARENEFAGVRDALVLLGGESVEALGAVLEGGDAALATQAVEVLARVSQPEAELHLLGAAFSPASPPAVCAAAAAALGPAASPAAAAAKLQVRAMKLYAQQAPLDVRAGGKVLVWSWDADKKRALAAAMSPPEASLALAARFAARARSILPEHPELRRLYLASVLEGAALAAGYDQPLPAAAAKAIRDALEQGGVEVLNDLLAEALQRGRPVVATQAARILGDVGTADLLRTSGARLSPLVQAARSADRRVRFAATEAIVRLEPQGPFPGDSFVGESVEFFIRSRGLPQALAGDIRADEAQTMAGLLAAAGFEAEGAAGHYNFLRQAFTSPDYELLVIDYVQASINSAQLLSDLRQDNRTAAVPILVVAEAEDLNLAGTLALRQPRVAVMPRPHGAEGMKLAAARALEAFGGQIVPREQRLAQAAAAIGWATRSPMIAAVLRGRRSFDRVIEDALQVPELRAAALALVVERGKASGQRALVELASRGTEPIQVRQVAAQAFADSVARHGTLLTTSEIALQYQRYNASETQPKEVQDVLGAILDAIETRAAKASLPTAAKSPG